MSVVLALEDHRVDSQLLLSDEIPIALKGHDLYEHIIHLFDGSTNLPTMQLDSSMLEVETFFRGSNCSGSRH